LQFNFSQIYPIKLSSQTPVFIINPIAGAKKVNSKKLIEEFLSSNKLMGIIETTTEKNHGKTLTKKYLEEGFRHFVAVGGDGTVNEVASQLINTEAYFSIIPLGSGNGLARTLKIPMNPNEALDKVFNGKKSVMDIGLINDLPFFCTAGVGFDAHCAKQFATGNHSRGLWNYIKVILSGYFSYQTNQSIFCEQPKEYFSVTFANANQFGNNAYIAPDAVLDDNQLDCTIIEKHPKWYGMVMGFLLMSGKIRQSSYVEYYRGTEFSLRHNEKILMHIDGEYVEPFSDNIIAQTLPHALKLII
jgi:diacylglycerol kinase (ATP)